MTQNGAFYFRKEFEWEWPHLTFAPTKFSQLWMAGMGREAGAQTARKTKVKLF